MEVCTVAPKFQVVLWLEFSWTSLWLYVFLSSMISILYWVSWTKKNIRLQIGLSGFYICFYTPSTCRVCTLLTIKQMLAWYRSILNTGRLRCLHGAGSHYPSVPFHLVSRRICVVNRSRAFLARSLRKPSLAIYAVQASIHIIKFHQVLLVTKSSSPKVVVELGTTKDYGGAKHLCNQRDGAFSI